MLLFLFQISCSIDICFSTNHNGICSNNIFTVSSFDKIENIINLLNLQNDAEKHLNIYIDNTYKTPLLLNLNNFQLNSFTATLKGIKDSSFAVIDFCGRSYDDKSVFSYDGVTIHPKNVVGLSVGCIYSQNVDFQFPGFDSGKIFSKQLNRKKNLKSIISFDSSEGYTVFEFQLFPNFNHVLIKEDSIIISIEGQQGSMTIGGLRKGTAFLFQEERYQYPPMTIITDVTSEEADLPFFCLRCVKPTQLIIGKFPKQPNGIPPIGLDIQTSDEITVTGKSGVYSQFVLFDTKPLIKKTLKVNHADICPYHYGNDKKDQITLLFKDLAINYGSILKVSNSDISIQTDQIQSTAYSLRNVHQFESYDNNKFQQVPLSHGMNYLKLTDHQFTISEGPDKSPIFQINSSPNLNILVLQKDDSPASLTIDTQSSVQSLNNLPNIELLFSKESTLNVISNLEKDQDSHFQLYGDNLGKPVTIQSSTSKSFTFGLTDDICGDFIINGAKVLLQDKPVVNVGQINIKNTEFVQMDSKSNPIVSINNLYVNADFASQIPHLYVTSNFYILGEVKNGQIFPCQQGPNVYLDIPFGFNKLEVDSLDIILTDTNHQKSVVLDNISSVGHVYFTQKISSPTLYTFELITPSTQTQDPLFGCAIFDFIDNPSVTNTVNFIGDNWNKYSNQNSPIIELRTSRKLSVQFNGIIPAKIVNKPGGELTLIPSKTTFGFTELDLSGKTIISSSNKDNFIIFLNTFTINSTATFPLDRRTEINTKNINFELGAFSIIKSSKLEIVSELTDVTLRGDTELKTDFSLTYGGNSTKNFVLLGPTASCSLSIEDSNINYRRDQHVLTFQKFDNVTNIIISAKDSKIETEITSFHLNINSTFVFDNTIPLKGVAVMEYNSVIYARNDGKMIFSPKHDFITYYNLTNEFFPTIYAEKIPFEGKPFALSLYHPGEKELGRKFYRLVGQSVRTFCFPNFDCNDFLSCIDIEHPFKDNSYSFKPICIEHEAKNCVAFNITRDLYSPTPTRLPMPTTIAVPTKTPYIPTRTQEPTEITPPITSSDIEPDDSNNHKKKSKAGMIAGIVVGAVAVAALIGVLVWWLRRRYRNDEFISFDPSMKARLTGDNAL
ncbi:hypothetical protein M9Y10_021690 [Tritrichomonas musculus]|uniref:Transmembrane protein n=1 Tax=Tritrichomonas musculus TaxID=1915356 RepID=A0ABR2KQ34_9EUKA